MSLATFTSLMMTLGLIVHARNLQVAHGSPCGTLVWHERMRAAELGLLITILTMPWLILAAFLHHG